MFIAQVFTLYPDCFPGPLDKGLYGKAMEKKIWKLIQKTGDELIGRLPDHPSHPKGRNPYAHIALEIKNHFGMSYKDIEDDKIPELEKFIEFIQNNPR